jgi:hypothetical protein
MFVGKAGAYPQTLDEVGKAFPRQTLWLTMNILKLGPQKSNVPNKLECLSLAGFFSLVKCFWERLGAYPIV